MTVRPMIALVCAFSFVFPLPSAGAQAAIEDLEASYQFLVSLRSTDGGALYVPTEGSLKGIALPVSFYDSERYWGAYVCTLPDVSCAVTDYYNTTDYSLMPRSGDPAAVLQAERVNVHNGTNIYDAATWQIAVMLGTVMNKFHNSLGVDAYELAAHQSRVLGQVQDNPTVGPVRRATTAGKRFNYNGLQVTDPKEAYAFRMTGYKWLADDPLHESQYGRLIRAVGLPTDNLEYQVGRVSWSDWKPITGDNAWAFLVGPLQAAYLHYVTDKKGPVIPFEDPAVQSALEMLPTFAAMQSAVGAVYYAPSGTVENNADKAVDPYLVSVENNFSLYAGLRLLRATLLAEIAGDRGPESRTAPRIERALGLIQTMISGGTLPGGRTTLGMERFFRDYAWHDGEFVQGGIANDPASSRAWVPFLEPKAVDVNTWGVAALGAAQVDRWFGFGAAYRVWKGLKGWSAYGDGHNLWGVGYSSTDGNGVDAGGMYRHGVLSGEWTAGAITMVRDMIQHYHSVPQDSMSYTVSRQYEKELLEDEHSMLEGIQALRLDRYAAAELPGKPANYSTLIVGRTKPYLYASRRVRIPFGWYANPIPSTSSTAWVIMIADHYDPFGYGGKPN